MDPSSAKLSLKEKIGYGLGDTASNFVFHSVNVLLLFYYTDVFGISAAAAGTLFVVARVWDAINDPLMGALADRTHTRWGKYRPYLLWLAVPFGICGYLAFANPQFGESGKLVYAYVTYFLLMTIYTAINVPYSALMGVMTPSSAERTSLSSFRFVGAFSGQLLISMGALPLVKKLGEGDMATGFKYTMALFAVVAVILFIITFCTTRERIQTAVEKQDKVSIGKDMLFLLKNRPWVIMVIAAILTLSNAAIRWAVTPHFFKYYVGDDGTTVFWFLDRTSLIMTTGSLAFIAGIFFTGMLSRRFGKRNALIGLTILNALSLLAFYFIPPSAYSTMIVVNAIGSFIAGPTPALVWAIYTDVVEYGEWRFGRGTPGLAFSVATLAQQLGIAVGGGMAGWLLHFYGFQANQLQSESAISGLRTLFSLLPGILALGNGLVLFWYPLTESTVAQIESDLAERRGKLAISNDEPPTKAMLGEAPN
ncbi:MFS transporter [Luteolibacter sp. GHJ8]|uniref:MFS transporter n=1 Tax=Luteolibacter rhizosphaerae TaxID=2989719 RepID=A0ABT3FXR6_9BACT|nr:MFS transporter [Luteolibacter rhizosphaerae]MCW1912144.1 MFS transporter [Luteolibacter rhizosphaerae]